MEEIKIKVGDWVKEKNGTQGMSVVGYVKDKAGKETGQLRCRFKNAEGDEVESNFWESALTAI